MNGEHQQNGIRENVRQYYGLIVVGVLVLGVCAWATGQSLFEVLNGVLPL